MDDRHHRSADFERMIERTKFRRFKKRRGVRAKKNALPAKLINAMGEANKAYTRQAYDVARKLCNDIIAEAPQCPEPYITLGLVRTLSMCVCVRACVRLYVFVCW